ncbi:DNA polymerase zeta processivity subunit [Escovopsis weberi]|uniref:DNA polymerase zeta processivity subunit n=1 Tax=Escovopsis weberi TaxID=150374 RepID=A0A0N0RUA6_ESCWE|nr:DNA polymerase zeta processivity subunit [Escovopsis weberi]
MSSGPSLPASQADPLLSSFTSFLTIAIHSLLFHRELYPPASFLTTRAYNLPVHQSRHPLVCAWVADAVSALTPHLARGALSRIALVVHGPPTTTTSSNSNSNSNSSNSGAALPVLERWVFDVRDFPVWGALPKTPTAPPDADTEGPPDHPNPYPNPNPDAAALDAAPADTDAVNWADVHEQLRAALGRLALAGEKAPALPADCTFTLALELRDAADAPIGHPQPWIPSASNAPAAATGPAAPPERTSTVPVRSVRAGPLFFECWLETTDVQPSRVSQTTDEKPS